MQIVLAYKYIFVKKKYYFADVCSISYTKCLPSQSHAMHNVGYAVKIVVAALFCFSMACFIASGHLTS